MNHESHPREYVVSIRFDAHRRPLGVKVDGPPDGTTSTLLRQTLNHITNAHTSPRSGICRFCGCQPGKPCPSHKDVVPDWLTDTKSVCKECAGLF